MPFTFCVPRPLFPLLGFLSLGPLSAIGGDFSSPRLEAESSWIGNTYGGAKKWVQQDIHAMAVMPDGTIFTNVEWDEAGGNAGEFRDGEFVRYARHTHGWGYGGGAAVAVNARYVYLACQADNEGGGLRDLETWPAKGLHWAGVSRRQRADISKGAPFEGGKGGKGDTLPQAFLVVAEGPDKSTDAIKGLCADDSRLYVADGRESEIKVYDAETMKSLAAWKVDGVGPLAMDARGGIWMLEKRNGNLPGRLLRYGAEGKPAGAPLDFPTEMNPVAFCLGADGRVFVADDGPAQQIVIYAAPVDALKEVARLGERGGIAAGTPGAFGEWKLNHVVALGLDGKNRLYAAHDAQSGGGGTILASYDLASNKPEWRLFGLTFVDMADTDPGSDSEVYTKEEHFHLDYGQGAGREWSYAGYTIGALKYPQDPRLHLWSGGAWMRRIGGQRVLFVNDMNGERLQVYRFAPATDGDTAIPSGLLAKGHIPEKENWPPNQPVRGEWIWRDGNGNGAFDPGEYQTHGDENAPAAQGWWVDSAGGVWLAMEKKGVRYFPCQGLDAMGNPRWEYANMQEFPHPEGFQEVKRLRYDVVSDTLYLGGTTAEDHNQHWKPMGPIVVCYDGWLHGAKKLRWRIRLPYAKGSSGHESCEPMGFDLAGDYLFAPYTGASKADGVTTGRVEVFRLKDGGAVGHFEPGAEIGEVGLQDLRETLTARRRDNGEYVVMIEDDYKSKVVMYRWKP